MSELLHTENGNTVKVIYPSAFMLRPFGGAINCLRAANIVRQLLMEFQPDAVIAYNTYLFEFFAIREILSRKHLPFCLEIEDLPLARKRGVSNLKPLIDSFCWNGMLRNASSYLAVNKYIFDKLPNNKPKMLLPGVIDQKLFVKAKTRTSPFKNSYYLLGYFGALSAEKGVEVLLELVPNLAPPWKLIVTGSGHLSDKFELLSQKYPDRLQFLGCVPEQLMYDKMCICDCIVIPLERITGDGQGVFPFKTLEYLVSGAHIISTKLASQGDFDLSFMQIWDGNASSLLELLHSAKADYIKKIDLLNSAKEYVINNYTSVSIQQKLSYLLQIR